MNNSIHNKKRRRYKYTLHKDYHLEAFIYPDTFVSTRFIELGEHGWLAIRKGYAWDGPSDPAPDFKMLMRGSLVQ